MCQRNCFRERLNKLAMNLSEWLSARAALADSIAAQKCGLFHRQVILRKQTGVNMNQFNTLVKNIVPPSTTSAAGGSTYAPTEAVFKFAYRDNKPKKPLQESRYCNFILPVSNMKHRYMIPRLIYARQAPPRSRHDWQTRPTAA